MKFEFDVVGKGEKLTFLCKHDGVDYSFDDCLIFYEGGSIETLRDGQSLSKKVDVQRDFSDANLIDALYAHEYQPNDHLIIECVTPSQHAWFMNFLSRHKAALVPA